MANAKPRATARLTALSLVLTAGTAGAASIRDLPTEVLCDLIDDAELTEPNSPTRARLLSALTVDQRATVRAEAAAAMGSLWPNQAAEAAEELRRLARDVSDNVRVSAAVGLARAIERASAPERCGTAAGRFRTRAFRAAPRRCRGCERPRPCRRLRLPPARRRPAHVPARCSASAGRRRNTAPGWRRSARRSPGRRRGYRGPGMRARPRGEVSGWAPGSLRVSRVGGQGSGSWRVAHGEGRNSAEGGGKGACSSEFQLLRSPIVACVASSSTGRERPACQPPPIAL